MVNLLLPSLGVRLLGLFEGAYLLELRSSAGAFKKYIISINLECLIQTINYSCATCYIYKFTSV